MIFNKKQIFSFLALIAYTESFTTTSTTSAFVSNLKTSVSKVATCQKSSNQIRHSFGLKSIAEDTGSTETSAESDEQTTEVAEENDVAVTGESSDAAVEAPKSEDATEGESSGETTKQSYPEEDISKIAYVVNLSYDTPGYQLREMFSEIGEVQKVFMPKEKGTGKSKGIAFVTMSTEEERDATIEKLNGIECDGRTIYVDKAKPRSEKGEPRSERRTQGDPNSKKLYVGNISYETTKEDLMDFFQEYGEVKDVYVPVDRESGAPRGFAFVTMNSEEAEKAIEDASGVELQGRVIDVKESLPRGQKAPPRARSSKVPGSDEVKLYVGNLSFDTEEDTLRSVYGEFGQLIDVYQPLDRYSGRPRGFAFVTMDKESAARAIEETDGMELDGRILRVNEAQPKGYSQPNEEWNGDDGGDW